MQKKILYLMCGIPGSGKSTYIKEMCKKLNTKETVVVSRDAIRFALLEDSDEYFAHEDMVFKLFCQYIQNAIDSDDIKYIFADATHINESSRNHLLNKLKLDNVDICPVVMDTPIDICLKRNSKRTGRSRVPDAAIKQMHKNFRKPNFLEHYNYANIFKIWGGI